MKLYDVIEFDCGHGCSSEGLVVSVDEETERVKAVDFLDGSVWAGSMDNARVLAPEEINEALIHAGAQIRRLLPPYGPSKPKDEFEAGGKPF
ncbi:hypothetical protein LJR129_004901 [Acidovorax sp. LjRoot129]|uniref:hypothetical protein n=1 Tax=unclassified Acidovorax TaxID=2684926 RepID=UPI003ECF22EA